MSRCMEQRLAADKDRPFLSRDLSRIELSLPQRDADRDLPNAMPANRRNAMEWKADRDWGFESNRT